jgi:hypothetical protein
MKPTIRARYIADKAIYDDAEVCSASPIVNSRLNAHARPKLLARQLQHIVNSTHQCSELKPGFARNAKPTTEEKWGA